jgi:hypothetical protein
MVCSAILMGLIQRHERDLVPVPPSVRAFAHRIMVDASFIAWLRLEAFDLLASFDDTDGGAWMLAALRDQELRDRAAFHVVQRGLVGPEEIDALLADPHRSVRARTMVGLLERRTAKALARVVEVALAPCDPLMADVHSDARDILAVNRSLFVSRGGAC